MLQGTVNLRRGWAAEVQVEIPADRTTNIHVGDLCGIDSGDLVTAEDEAWDNDLATTQTNFVEKFLGVALNKHIVLADADAFYAGGPRPVRGVFGTAGNYDYTLDAASVGDALPIGTLVGPAENEDGDGLLADAVAVVPAAARAIGVISEAKTAGQSTVLVRIRSTLVDRDLG